MEKKSRELNNSVFVNFKIPYFIRNCVSDNLKFSLKSLFLCLTNKFIFQILKRVFSVKLSHYYILLV